jgi:hypothetical protein
VQLSTQLADLGAQYLEPRATPFYRVNPSKVVG